MYVYIYVYMYIYTVYVYMNIYIYLYTQINMCMCVYVYICVYPYENGLMTIPQRWVCNSTGMTGCICEGTDNLVDEIFLRLDNDLILGIGLYNMI